MMLVHIGQGGVAEKVHNAWLKTIEDGIHTGDIYQDGVSKTKVGTDDFCKAVIERMGEKPASLTPVSYPADKGALEVPPLKPMEKAQEKTLVGADVVVEWDGADNAAGSEELAAKVRQALVEGLELSVISNRGTKAWPNGSLETYCVPVWTLRFRSHGNAPLLNMTIVKQLDMLYNQAGIAFLKVEKLYRHGDKDGFTKAQGE